MDIKKTYLFYDIETTGLSKCFDQILQFAAIRTDLELNELAHHEIQIRLNPDAVPTPQAVLTHRMSIAEMQKGEPELIAIKKIHQLMNTPGTISLGYNTLGFDDEFLRFSFYRNLLSPYTHQYQNQCSRMDLYPIVALYYSLFPRAIEWPQLNGKITLKLENLSQANQLMDGPAHHAMTDVKACVALARKLMHTQETWQQALSYFDRTQEQRRYQQLTTMSSSFNRHREALMIQGGFGSEINFRIPVIELGPHHHYKNQTLWLRLDQEEIENKPYVIRKKQSEPPLLLPWHPQSLSAERFALAEQNKHWLQQHQNFFQALCAHHQNYVYPKVPNIDPDAALYENGFPTPQEEFLFQRFHLAELAQKEEIAERFPNVLHQKLALRALGRIQTSSLSKNNQQQFASYLQSVFQSPTADFRGQLRLTPTVALQQITELTCQPLDPAQQQLMTELERYIKNLTLS